MSLLIHQFEEYVFPGGAPLVINQGTWNEKENYRRYPGNTQSGMIVNTSAYLFYIAAIVFPQYIWLGLGTMFFSLFQFIGHGIQMNKTIGTWYNPGLASVIILFIPISVYYIVFINDHRLATVGDWVWGAFTFVAGFVVTTILPVQLLKDKNSPYIISEWQVHQFEKVKSFASIKKNKPQIRI